MNKNIINFQKKILGFYKKSGRHGLPWRRRGRTPYQVVMSEIMLQQTQVDRVIPFFKAWMQRFPTWQKLASAPQSEVLRYWKGLGYNSRALRLHRLAQTVTQEYGGKLPSSRAELEELPGIGPYTAGAIRVFAFGKKDVFIETNIRRIFLHEFFNTPHPAGRRGAPLIQGEPSREIHDKEILKLVEETLPKKNVFTWYSALMDYGSTLPKILKHKPNTKSKHYTRQSKFQGSNRQKRGRLLADLLEKKSVMVSKYDKKVVEQLQKEGFVVVKNGRIQLK